MMQKKLEKLSLLARKSSEYFSSLKNDSLVCVSFETRNWGDWLNKWLIEKITGKSVTIAHINHLKVCEFIGLLNSDRAVFTAIGSIMHFVPRDAFVWGTGCIYKTGNLSIKPGNILSVRGPLTAQVLANNGFERPTLYGDPALLLEKYVDLSPIARKTYAIGIIPHHSEWSEPAVKSLSSIGEILMIDIEGGHEKIISQISQCECIFSSSLHGLILSDVLRVPNKWVRFRRDFPGEGFKFNDYYKSLNGAFSEELRPIEIGNDNVGSSFLSKLSREAFVHDHNINLDEVEGVFTGFLKKNGWL